MNVSQLFDLALQHHRGGNLHQAERLYRQILEFDPRHAAALHMFGLIAHQVGRNDLAVEYMQEALRLQPECPEACNNLGIVLAALGRLGEAIASYQQALRLKPDDAGAYNNLGNALKHQGKFAEAIANYQQVLRLKPDFAEAHNNLGIARHAQGKYAEAVANYQQALRLKPDLAEAYLNLGIALKAQEKVTEAVANYQQALRLKPDLAEVHLNLGIALKAQEKFTEAVASYQQALRLKPDFADAYLNLGIVQHARGKFAEAAVNYQQVLRLKPDFAEAYLNLGCVLKDQGKFAEAVAGYRQALRLKPDLAEAHYNLGIALKAQGKLEEAIANYQQALRLKPDFADALSNLGIALHAQGKFEEASASYQQALRLKPDLAEAHYNLGSTLKEQGKLGEAIANYRQALRLKPDFLVAHHNLIYILHYHPDYDSAAIFREARSWNDRHAEPLAQFRQPHRNTVEPERRLRIGYVSPDFRNHPVTNFTMPLLSNHDHRQVEVFCYAEVAHPDDMTDRLRACADVWRVTVGLTDERMAEMVRSDRIDILVDLALHTANNRLLVFARKPAPVQVTWLGCPGTTGLSTIDYRVTDAYLDPPGLDDASYSEESIRLPDTYWCYDPCTTQFPMVNDLPAAQNGFLTFGCLNNFCKVNDFSLSLWAQALRAAPGSRLLLRTPRDPARDRVLAKLQSEGIAASRVEMIDRQPTALDYLQKYHAIDVCLDPMPYNGHTTSLEAFWMGVPTMTLIGKTVVGRVGWSVLGNLGLPEFAARTPQEYVAIAVRLAGDLLRLRDLRASMRARMRASPLMDARRFAGHMEDAYRQMWRKWCRSR